MESSPGKSSGKEKGSCQKGSCQESTGKESTCQEGFGKSQEVDNTWITRAACAGLPTEWFFPLKTNRNLFDGREICALCPVTQECLDYLVAMNIEFGIWGGKREFQRKRLLRDPPIM